MVEFYERPFFLDLTRNNSGHNRGCSNAQIPNQSAIDMDRR
jgi:hypothetical protein